MFTYSNGFSPMHSNPDIIILATQKNIMSYAVTSIFCGNTVTWNVGAAAGPGKCYSAERLVGVEIDPEPALLARRNLASIGMEQVSILSEDGLDTIDRVDYPIDLLYLDPNGFDPESGQNNTKRLYYTMIKRAMPKLAPGAVVIAHDTLIPRFAEQAQVYLDYMRDSANFRASFSVEIDEEGVEISFL
jgi:predicted O-methyltransferase YrrM